MSKQIIYLDYNATTPLDPRVLASMMPYLTNVYGNSSSAHTMGTEANKAVKKARNAIASLLNCNSEDIIFTAGATESINIALRGVVQHQRFRQRKHVVTVATEHPAVLDTCRYLESRGVRVTYLPVDGRGILDLEVLKAAMTDQTALVCVMLVNNETGVIQPIQQIAQIARSFGALFMSDATQAVGKIPVDVIEQEIDLLAFSGHKFYGPKGVGGLYINPRLRLEPLVYGGGHERGLRSGSLNVPGIVGMGSAAQLAQVEMYDDQKRIQQYATELKNSLLKIEGTSLNGCDISRLASTLNICFEGIDGEALRLNLKSVCISNGSACSSLSIEPSHVLLNMGLSRNQANSSLRFSLGRFTTREEINITADRVNQAVHQLKLMAA